MFMSLYLDTSAETPDILCVTPFPFLGSWSPVAGKQGDYGLGVTEVLEFSSEGH